MSDKHNYSFFGKSSALQVQTDSRPEKNGQVSEKLWFRIIKKKNDGNWEKPSLQEGKASSFSLGEQIQMLKIFEDPSKEFNAYHKFKETETQISMNWKEDFSGIWVNLGKNYSKFLDETQTELFRRLLEHIVQEKIALAT
jgi:hypothetical protein